MIYPYCICPNSWADFLDNGVAVGEDIEFEYEEGVEGKEEGDMIEIGKEANEKVEEEGRVVASRRSAWWRR